MSFRNLYEISLLLVLVFDVLAGQTPEDLGLRKLEKKENFIKVTYKSETKYPDGFENVYRKEIALIKRGNDIFQVKDNLTIGANETIEIHFTEPVKSLSNFFFYSSLLRMGMKILKISFRSILKRN